MCGSVSCVVWDASLMLGVREWYMLFAVLSRADTSS